MASNRSRKWFLTINESAECYLSLNDRLNALSRCKWAYIIHSLDTDENGQLKKRHYHAVLEFENPRTFESVQESFKGAHIEQPISFSRSVQYLVHKNDGAKYQYSWPCVVSNDINYYTSIYNNEIQTITKFDFNKLRDYIIKFETSCTTKDFIYFLLGEFPLDYRRIMKDKKLIEDCVNLICENDDDLLKDSNETLKNMLF